MHPFSRHTRGHQFAAVLALCVVLGPRFTDARSIESDSRRATPARVQKNPKRSRPPARPDPAVNARPIPASQEFSSQARLRMLRDLAGAQAKDQVFDLCVSGAGYVGASVARLAALNGLKVLVADKGDLACEASGGSTNIQHGGALYLQRAQRALNDAWQPWNRLLRGHKDSATVRSTVGESLPHAKAAWNNLRTCFHLQRESEIVLRQSPEITKRTRIHMVVHKDDRRRSPEDAYAGLMLLWLSGGCRTEPPRLYTREDTLEKRYPELNLEQAKGVVTFQETVTDGAMLTVYAAKHAHQRRAVTLPHVSVEGAEYDPDNDLYRVQLRTREKQALTVKARRFCNASGTGIDAVHASIRDPAVTGDAVPRRFVRTVSAGHLLMKAENIGSQRSYLLSIPRSEDGVTEYRSGERKDIFAIHRDDLQLRGSEHAPADTTSARYEFSEHSELDPTSRVYQIDTNDWDPSALDSEQRWLVPSRQRSFTLEQLNRLFFKDIGTNAVMTLPKKALVFSDDADTHNITRDYALTDVAGRYFVLAGVKLSLGRVAAEETVRRILGTLEAGSVRMPLDRGTGPLDIPRNPYRRSLEYKQAEQMLIDRDDSAALRRRCGPASETILPSPQDHCGSFDPVDYGAYKKRVQRFFDNL